MSEKHQTNAADRLHMLVRCEFWFAADDRSILRRNAAPALYITEPTEEPIALPSFGGNRLVMDVRALDGNVVVEIGTTDDAANYDPIAQGRLLLAGESQRFLVFAESFVIVREWTADTAE